MTALTTGNPAFDRILGGGLPARSATFVIGEPGSGKTLFALQLLFHLAGQGKKGLYFTTLSEPSLKLFHHMQQLAFYDARLLAESLVFADLGTVIRAGGLDATLDEIVARVESETPDLVVIDSFKAVRELIGDANATRMFFYDLSVTLATRGVTSLFVGAYTEHDLTTKAELAIADGVIRFGSRREDQAVFREVQVLKLRGAHYRGGVHACEIGPAGLAVFPRVARREGPRLAPVSPRARLSSGVGGLDEMLGGGLPAASVTLVEGGAGTGKTLLGLQFLIDGARRGEAGVLHSTEETPEELREIAAACGWDLAALEAKGLLTLHHRSPIELSGERFLHDLAETGGARRAVLDSLTSLGVGIASPPRLRALICAAADHLRARGVTALMNLESAAELPGVSFAVDGLVQLRCSERDAVLSRSVAVLKLRGSHHAMDVRPLRIGDAGLEVGTPFAEPRRRPHVAR